MAKRKDHVTRAQSSIDRNIFWWKGIFNLISNLNNTFDKKPFASSTRRDSLLLSRIVCRVEDLPDFSVNNDGIVTDDVSVALAVEKCDAATDRASSKGSSLDDPSSGERSCKIRVPDADDAIRPPTTFFTIDLRCPKPGFVVIGQPQRASICRQRWVRSDKSWVTSRRDFLASRIDLST